MSECDFHIGLPIGPTAHTRRLYAIPRVKYTIPRCDYAAIWSRPPVSGRDAATLGHDLDMRSSTRSRSDSGQLEISELAEFGYWTWESTAVKIARDSRRERRWLEPSDFEVDLAGLGAERLALIDMWDPEQASINAGFVDRSLELAPDFAEVREDNGEISPFIYGML